MIQKRNIAMITIDSLRYDAFMQANIPNLSSILSNSKAVIRKVYAQGTYTLPAHISLFQSGILPYNTFNTDPETTDYFVHHTKKRAFNVKLEWYRNKKAEYNIPESDNLIKGLQSIGYRTVGVGGVGWFSSNYRTSSSIWTNYFQEFYWKEIFSETNPNSFEEQITFCQRLNLADVAPLFFFP